MDIRKLQRAIVDGLEDVKAHDIVVFNTEHLSPLFERVIVASGTSNRQTKALASSVRDTVKSRGMPILSVEGADNGEWIIVDCGAAVAHIMQPAIRDYYRLEEIWGGKAVKMKIDAGEGRTAAKPEVRAPAPAAGRTVVRAAARAPQRQDQARASARKSPAGAPRKTAAKSAPGAARKSAAPRQAGKPGPARKQAAGRGGARKPSTRSR